MQTCQKCGTYNEDTDKFCKKCGTQLQTTVQAPVSQQITGDPNHNYPNQIANPPLGAQNNQQMNVQPPLYNQQYGVGRSQMRNGMQNSRMLPNSMMSNGRSISTANIWGPFAGYGERSQHTGWLMDNQADKADELIQSVTKQFVERQIPDTYINIETLTGKGVFVENRQFFILRRGLTSMALYINRFGKDLYISLASYLKPPISNFRVILNLAISLFAVIMSFSYGKMLAGEISGASNSLFGFGGGFDIEKILTLLCVLGPLTIISYLYMIYLVINSIRYFIRDKDILYAFRAKTNEFNQDDLMAMEKAVEQTLKLGMDQIGLDFDQLKKSNISFDQNTKRII